MGYSYVSFILKRIIRAMRTYAPIFQYNLPHAAKYIHKYKRPSSIKKD